MPDFQPSASWPALQLRAALLRRLRDFFDEREFLEVETPILSADIVVDRHLDPLSITLADDPRQGEAGRTLWLQTSPEAAMKRLLAAGAEAIYQVARVFRGGERGRLHNPEFTLAEWYRRGDDMAAGMTLLSELCDALLSRGEAERVSYREAFLRHAEVDPHGATLDDLQAAASGKNLGGASLGDDRDAWLNLLLVELVQPQLGRGRPTIMFDFPASQAALARIRDGSPPVAERFELFVEGIELANGYHELLDPTELRRRTAEANHQRRADGKPPLPEPEMLVQAMEHGLPPCSGAALGFDRLVMLAAGSDRIDDVVAFPIDRA